MQLPEWVFQMETSDYLIVAGLLAIAWFVLDYGLATPWWRRQHGYIGYIVMLFNLSILGLLFLIMWGIVAGQRVDEIARVPIAALVLFGALGKITILHYERSRGTIERRKNKATLSTPTPDKETS